MRKIDARWRIGYVTNGYYTTKSTYRLLLKVVEAATPGTSNSAAQKLFWQELWSLNVPNKICHFLWRVANDSLPTKKNLQKRNITQDPTYDRCRDGIEDGIHAIWGCQWLNKCGGNWKIAESTWTKNLLASMICCKESLFRKTQSWLSYLLLSGGVYGMNVMQEGWAHLLCQWRKFTEMLWNVWKSSILSKKNLETK